MSEKIVSPVPTWFWVAAGVALAWNLMGVAAYLMQVSMTDQAIADLPEAQRQLYELMPAWVTGAFAIAVFAGALGCIALLLRRSWATMLLIVSLAAIVAQQIYLYFLSDTFAVMGGSAMIMPMIVLLIGIFLVWFSRRCDSLGWLR